MILHELYGLRMVELVPIGVLASNYGTCSCYWNQRVGEGEEKERGGRESLGQFPNSGSHSRGKMGSGRKVGRNHWWQ